MVISGGVNVPTPAVAARLREHLAVAAAEVLGVPDDEWGHRVVAFVVGDLDLAAARDRVAAAHPRSGRRARWSPWTRSRCSTTASPTDCGAVVRRSRQAR